MKNIINDKKTNKIYIFPKIFPPLNPVESIKYLYIFIKDSLTKELSQLKDSSNDNIIEKDIVNNETQFDLIENIIELQKGKKKRNSKIKNIIYEFLSKTDIYDKIKEFEINSYEKFLDNSILHNQANNEEIIFSKIQEKINLLVENISFGKIKKGDFLVKINDKMNYVYFLVIGRLALLKPIQLNNYQITCTEYIQYLLDLKIKKENYLLEETLKLNSSILQIESLNQFKQFIKIYFQIKINEILKNNLITFPQIEDYLNEYQMKFEDLDINKEEMEQIYIKSLKTQNNNYWSDYIKKSFKISGTSLNFFSPYQKIFQTNEQLNFTIFRYDLSSYLIPGNYYGDDSNENSSVRAEENSLYAFISKELYLNVTSENKKKEKLKELLFLWENFIFTHLSPLIFEKYFFPLFKLIELKRNDILYEQGSEITNLYIIKEGQVTINFYGNMIDIFNIIKFCIDTIIEKNPTNLTINELNQLKILYLNDIELLKIKRKESFLKNEISKKHNFEICIMDGYIFFVLDEFFLSNNHLTTCKVSTEKAKLYKINKSDFSRIIKEEKNIKTQFLNLAYNQIISLIKRLYNLKKSIISIAHYKVELANKDIKNYLEENKRLNLSQNKFFIYQNEETHKIINRNSLLQNEKKKLKYNHKSQDNLMNIPKIQSINKKDKINNINYHNFNFRKNVKTNDDVKFTNLRLKNIRNEFLNNKNVNIKTIIKVNNSYIDVDSFQNEFSKQKYLYQKKENKKIIGVNLFNLNKNNQKSNILNNQGFIGNKIINKKKRKIHRRTMDGILQDISKTFDKNLIKNSSKKILVNTVRKYYQNFQKYSYILKLDNNKFIRSNSVLNMIPKIQINQN